MVANTVMTYGRIVYGSLVSTTIWAEYNHDLHNSEVMPTVVTKLVLTKGNNL